MTSEEPLKKPSSNRKPNAEQSQFVGIGNLPKQVRRKSVKKGFQFTIMVVGESGLGKSTLLNSLFLSDLYVEGGCKEPCSIFDKTMSINESTLELREGNVRLKLTVIDTPGFGDHIDNTDSWSAIVNNIDSKFEDYLNAESRVIRTNIQDSRVHCCLYFIAPTGHGLKQLDIEFMRKLHNKINIIPVIAKADTLTQEECAKFKQQILREIEEHHINVYRFPPLRENESPKDLDYVNRIPFAVVGSNAVMEVGGKKIRGRKYPWGIVDVENLEHCDFIALRNLLVRSHMQDLIDVTNDEHYERYRSDKLAAVTSGGGDIVVTSNVNPLEQIEREREEREKKLRTMESEMEQVFSVKVNEKKKKLLDAEQEFNRKYDDTMEALARSRREVEERRKRFEEERSHFDQTDFLVEEGKKEKKKHKNK